MRELYDKFAELGLPIEGSTGEKSVDDDNQIESQEDES
jgi:hypothetical protein